MRFRDTLSRLEYALARELPGPAAQDALAPIPRREWPSGFNPARIRNAAGLLLVYPDVGPGLFSRDEGKNSSSDLAGRTHIVLTVRADTLGRHGGQVSLPGGVVEPGETFEQAAIREAHEEIALKPETVRVLGALTPIDIPVSGFRLHPVVAAAEAPPALHPADGEVARIVQLAVEELMEPSSVRLTYRTRDGRRLKVPAFYVGDTEIWGATAMVLAEFLALLGWRR